MKLIDMLVEDGLNGWKWPDGIGAITQDNGSSIYKGVAFGYAKKPYLKGNIWLANNGTGHADAKIKRYDVVADDWSTAIITREQYEAALAAKNDGWIEWGGGECPVEKGALVDVKHLDGEIYQNKPAMGDNNVCWSHNGSHGDIIAYRLHKPHEAEQAQEDGEVGLSERIGQDATPVWNGDGAIPPVGCICESSWVGDEWQQCEILFRSNQFVVVKLKESGMEDSYNIGDVIFRPIRPEAELKRDEAVKTIMLTGWCQTAAEEIYDLIAAGKVPGMKLED